MAVQLTPVLPWISAVVLYRGRSVSRNWQNEALSIHSVHLHQMLYFQRFFTILFMKAHSIVPWAWMDKWAQKGCLSYILNFNHSGVPLAGPRSPVLGVWLLSLSNVCVNSKCSGKSAHLCSLHWTITVHKYTQHPFSMSQLKCIHCHNNVLTKSNENFLVINGGTNMFAFQLVVYRWYLVK